MGIEMREVFPLEMILEDFLNKMNPGLSLKNWVVLAAKVIGIASKEK